MKRIFAKITTACVVAAALFATGCLSDDIEQSSSSGGAAADPVIPDNSTIESAVFEALNLDYRGLETVKSLRDADQYYLAAQALLEYYRGRTDVPNNHVSLIAPSISAAEQAWADHASADGKYRFYVEGYDDGGQPYSYANASGKLDWKLNSADEEQHYRVHRHAWMIAQGKAYRTSLDESYAESWVEVYENWLDNYPLPAVETVADDASETSNEAKFAWRPIDVAYRLEDQCDLIYYFMQSSSLTPQLFARFLANVAQEAEYLSANYSEDEAEKAVQAHAVFRAGLIFPEMVRAAEWKTEGSESMNEGIDMRVFDVLNLDYSGLAKVKTAYDQRDYGLALDELLAYYRTRPHDRNPNVDLANTSASATEKKWADYAFKEQGYRFYVKNYYDASAGAEVPYSYMNAAGDGIDWMLRHTGEQEQLYQIHRHQWMIPQAKTYRTTKEEKYVENWMEVYGDWIQNVPKPEQGTDVTNHRSWRPLEAASRLIDQCALLEYYQDSPTITAEWLAEVLVRLDEEANHIVNNYSETSNHLITQAQAVTFAGMLFPELKNSAAWKQSGCGVLNREVTAQYFPDGWLKDGDLHYHISGISDFRLAMRVAQLNGDTNSFSPDYVEAMRKMTEVVMNMIYPDYTVPNMADTRRDQSWTKNVLLRNLKEYCELFPDNQEMLWMASEGKEGTMPEAKFVTFPDAGYYVMRTGWTTDDLMMVLQNTPDQPNNSAPNYQWHRQFDNNTFELWCKGRNFFPDSGCYTYGGTSSSNADRRKYAATSAHNTLTLDNQNVWGEGRMFGEFTGASSGHTWQGLTLENPSYEGLKHRRTVYLVDDRFYILLDEAIGNAAGTVNLHFHLIEGKDAEIVYDSDKNGCHTAFADKNNLLVRTFPSKKCTFAGREGFVSYAINKTEARKSYQLDVVKTADEDVLRFVTVLLPTKEAAENVNVTLGEDSFVVKIGSKTYPAMKYTYTK